MKQLIALLLLLTLSAQAQTLFTNVNVPAAAYGNQTTATNIYSHVAKALNSHSTISLNQTNTIANELVGLTNTQTIAGNKTFTGTNNFDDAANLFHGTLTNAAIYATDGAITNIDAFNLTVYGGTYSGNIGNATNGAFLSPDLDGITLTNNATVQGNFYFQHTNGNRIFFDGNTFGFYDQSADENALYVQSGGAFAASLELTSSLQIGVTNNGFIDSGNGKIKLSDGLILGHSFSFPQKAISTLANGSNAGIDPGTNTFLVLSGNTAEATLNGFAGGFDGRVLYVKNGSDYDHVFPQQSGVDPAATNRFASANYTNGAKSVIQIIYDSAESRWSVVGK